MVIPTAAMVCALTFLMIAGYYRAESNMVDAEADLGVAHAIMTLQNAVIRRHVDERAPAAQDLIVFAEPEQVAMQDFVATYLPTSPFASSGALVTTVDTVPPVGERQAVLIEGYTHPRGDRVGLVWRDRVVEIHVIGDFDRTAVASVAQYVPQVALIDSTNSTQPTSFTCEPGATPTDPCVSPLHRLASATQSIAMVVPHPVISSGLRNAMMLNDNDDTEFGAPAAFHDVALAVEDEPCGGRNAITVDADGYPLVCADAHLTGRRIWKRIDEPDRAYCIDERSGSVSTTAATNVVLEYEDTWSTADWGRRILKSRDLVVPGIQLIADDNPDAIACPAGWTLRAGTKFCERSGRHLANRRADT